MRKIFYILIPILFINNLYTQVVGGQNLKLQTLFNTGKYEDCMFKAERLTQSDKTSKDPEPYLYMSMCFYEISLKEEGELKESYKNPLNDALKYALKYRMKDRKNELYEQNMEYFIKLTGAVGREASAAISSGDYRKPISLYTNALKLVEDTIILFSKGVCEVLTKNFTGEKNIQTSLKYLKERMENEDYKKSIPSELKEILVDGTLAYCDYLVDNNQEETAKDIIQTTYAILPEEKIIKNRFMKLWNIKEDERPEYKNGVKMIYKQFESEQDSMLSIPKDTIQTTPADSLRN